MRLYAFIIAAAALLFAGCVSTKPPDMTNDRFQCDSVATIDVTIEDDLKLFKAIELDDKTRNFRFNWHYIGPYLSTDTDGCILKGLIFQIASAKNEYGWNFMDARSYEYRSVAGGTARINGQLYQTGIRIEGYFPFVLNPMVEADGIKLCGEYITKEYVYSPGRTRGIQINYIEKIDDEIKKKLAEWIRVKSSGIGFRKFDHYPDSREYVPDPELADLVDAFEKRADQAVQATESKRYSSSLGK